MLNLHEVLNVKQAHHDMIATQAILDHSNYYLLFLTPKIDNLQERKSNRLQSL